MGTKNIDRIPETADEALRLVTALDEEVFLRKYGVRSTATHTTVVKTQSVHEARERLGTFSDEDVNRLKSSVSIMRKYTCLAKMTFLKNEGDWMNKMIDAE